MVAPANLGVFKSNALAALSNMLNAKVCEVGNPIVTSPFSVINVSSSASSPVEFETEFLHDGRHDAHLEHNAITTPMAPSVLEVFREPHRIVTDSTIELAGVSQINLATSPPINPIEPASVDSIESVMATPNVQDEQYLSFSEDVDEDDDEDDDENDENDEDDNTLKAREYLVKLIYQ